MPKLITARLVTAVVFAGLAVATSAASAQAAELGAVNTVTSRESAYVDVELPRSVAIEPSALGGNKNFAVTGGGRFGGVMLKQLGVADASAAAVVVSRFDFDFFCPACAAKPVNFQPVGLINVDFVDGAFRLPAGRYRLYAFGAGEEVRATLSFPELSGERTFSPREPNPVEARPIPGRDPVPRDELYVYGDTFSPKTPSVILDAALVYFRARAASEIFVCGYEGAPTHPLAFYPGCPAEPGQRTTAVNFGNFIVSPQPIATSTYGAKLYPPGTYGIGGSYTSAALVDAAGAVSLTVPVGPAPGGGEPLAPAPTSPPPPASPPGSQPMWQSTSQPTGDARGPGSPRAGSRADGSGLVVASRRLRARRGRVVVPLRCQGGDRCRGKVSLGRGAAAVALAPGQLGKVALRLPRSTRAKLRRGSSATVLVRLVAASGDRTTQKVTVRG